MCRETQTMDQLVARSKAVTVARLTLLPFAMLLAWSEPALAYVGPGAGISLLGALGAVIMAILFALGGLIWWPVRAMRRRRKHSAAAAAGAKGDQSD